LDFLLVTHNHDDHYNMRLLRAMSAHKKKVISNFFAADGYSKYPAFFEMSDTVSITTNETDHNSVLKKFMTTFQMECRTQQGGEVVLFSSGDTCNAAQLCPSKPVDVYIVHPRVGLSVLE